MVLSFRLLYFSCCAIFLCMGLILRSSVITNKLAVNVINTKV
jgi:hypothetical protein